MQLSKEEDQESIREHLISSWSAPREEIEKFKIIINYEEYINYSGYGYYLLEEISTGNFFELHGSHCSCYGFEDQFNLSEVSLTYLLSKHNPSISDDIKKELQVSYLQQCHFCNEKFCSLQELLVHMDSEEEKGNVDEKFSMILHSKMN